MMRRNALSDKSNNIRSRTTEGDLKSAPLQNQSGTKVTVMERLLSRNLVVRNGTKNSNMRESTKRPHSTQPVPVSSSNNKRRKATCISVLKETPPDAPTQRQQQQQQQQEDNPDSVSRSSSPTYNVSPSDLIDEDDEEDDIPKRTQISDFSVECLHRIFAFCANPRDLCTISTVCRKWHEIVCDPWMWRDLDMDWPSFTLHMYKLFLRKLTTKSLSYTRSMRLHGNPVILKKYRLHVPTIYPFKSLQSLHLQDMFLDDMVEIAMWMTNLETLRCNNVIIRQDNNEIMLTVFSRLQKLRILSITFNQPCSHAGHAFSITGRSRKALPSSLEELSITDLYDSEEYLMSKTEIHLAYNNPELMMRWNLMEESLLAKYRPFSHLSHLRSLCLGRCSGFTARIWRECLLPCTANLEHLSLTGWRSGRESPSAWQRRQAHAIASNIDIQEVPEQVEEAIAEVIGNMQRIRSLELNDFHCGLGIVQGISSLTYLQPSIVGASVLKAHGPLDSIADLLHVHVSFCKIMFKTSDKRIQR